MTDTPTRQTSRKDRVEYTTSAGEPGIRVGLDLASVAEVMTAIERFGDHYTGRLFTPDELADCAGAAPSRAASLAGRFAAKEAVLKVLAPQDDPPGWKMIEICRDPAGRCRIVLHDRARQLAEEAGLSGWSVSMTHEGNVAAAVVVAMHQSPATS